MRHPLFRLCNLVAVGILLSGCARSEKLWQVEDFSFVNQDDKPVTREDLQGKVWIAGFIFTRCPGPCAQISGSMARLQHDLAGHKQVLLVSFTVDPEYDTPAVLKSYASRFGANPRRWFFLTGDKEKLYHLIDKGFHLGVTEAQGEVTHSVKLALVDGEGFARGYFDGTNEEDLNKLEEAVAELTWGEDLPALNAIFNGTSAVLLLLGYFFIRRRLVRPHVACMVAAFSVSVLFLASYLYYHIVVKKGAPTPFPGEGPMRAVYLGILLSHTILAAVTAPLAVATLYQGLRGNFPRHVRLARWTFPIWLYVSVTGVLVYWMLYHLYA